MRSSLSQLSQISAVSCAQELVNEGAQMLEIEIEIDLLTEEMKDNTRMTYSPSYC